MIRLTFLLAAIAFLAGSATAESPSPKELTISPTDLSRARELVNKFASEGFDEREDAQDELAKMGRLAMPALLDGLNANPSPEVRYRCQSLLPKAAQADLQARLATFLADTEGKFNHDLPGWNEFKKIAGTSPTSRTVFVELLKESPNRTLVLAIPGPPSELGSLVAARKQEMYQLRFARVNLPTPTPRKEQTIPDVIALMFAESHVASKYIPRTVPNVTVYNIAGLNVAVTDGSEKAATYKAIVGHWIETRDDALSMYTAMNQAAAMGLPKQGAVVAAKLLQLKGGAITYRFYAAFAIAKNGSKEHLSALESAFNDDAGLNQQRVVNGLVQQSQLQLRDMALAAAVLLTGQNAEDYGLVEQYKNQPGMQYMYSNWRLPEEKRKAAFEKWKDWRAKNPDFDKVKN